MASGTQQSEEREVTDTTTNELRRAIDLVGEGLNTTSGAILQGAVILNESSEKFAKKAPGQRASWLGYILVFAAMIAELLQGFPKIGFDFSDQFSLGMMVMGGVLVAAGGAFDTYFTIKIASAHEARAAALEKAGNEALAQGNKARSEGLSVLKSILGRQS